MIRVIHITFLLLTTTITGVAQQSILDSLESRAVNEVEQYNYQGAADLYGELSQLDTTNNKYLQLAGKYSFQSGDSKSAKEYYTKLEDKDPENRLMLNHLANLYEQEDNAPKAIKYYTKLTKLYPENGLYFRKCGVLYDKAGEVKDAFTFLSKSHELNSRDLTTIRSLAGMFIKNGQLLEADTLLWKGLKYDSLNVGLMLLKATNSYKQKAYDSTALILKMASGRVDLNNYYNKMLGYAYLQIDSFERSIVYLQRSLVDENNPESAHYYLATAYEKLEDKETSIYHFEKAIVSGISTNISVYHRNLARLHNEDENLKPAIKHYEDAYRYNKDPLILFFLARATDVYYKDKNVAMRYYKRYYDSTHDNEEYKSYAKERRKYLKEQQHFKTN